MARSRTPANVGIAHGSARLLVACCINVLTLAVFSVRAEEPSPPTATAFLGLLRVRDMTPFGFLRLDMRQSPATFATFSRPSIEVDLGYQNTWALTDDVKGYLNSRPRGPLTEADVTTLRAMPGEQYLLDVEIALLEVALNYPLTDRLGAYAVISAARYSGGFLDGLVEGFHRTFGIDQVGRPGMTRNQVNVFYDLKGLQYTQLDRPSDQGLLDPVLGLRYALMRDPGSVDVVLEAAVKIPTSDDPYFSTGRADVGSQVSMRMLKGRHAFYASGALVYYAGSSAPFNDSPMLIPTGIVGYEFGWWPRTSVIAQLYVSRSDYKTDETDLGDLHKTKYEVSIGLRQYLQRAYWSFAVTENVINFNNTPDVVFQLSLGFEL